MNLFGFGKKDVPVQEYVVPASPYVNFQSLADAGLRKNMWVVTSEGVGIVTGSDEDGMFLVALAKEDGSNKMVIDEFDKAVTYVFKTKEARKASIDEIPVSRRGGAV